ncbi:hypothetical protein AOC05_00345 [Arthrobacter alpinus]|uniref:Uncharacterized protein n=1 Tax=Arthrobacter alpinus TaxID=656366 RepID=A0A0M4QUG3_9MICC|nr:hypothetical protein AOC05_00345 [Arthrobacter alpinus]
MCRAGPTREQFDTTSYKKFSYRRRCHNDQFRPAQPGLFENLFVPGEKYVRTDGLCFKDEIPVSPDR